jgi:vancomycin permeability regulator SanA
MSDGTKGSPTREEARILFLKDSPERADLALVFGHCDPRVSASRTRHAAKLFLEGFVPRLLLSGGSDSRGCKTSEAEQMARVARELGVPASVLLLKAVPFKS